MNEYDVSMKAVTDVRICGVGVNAEGSEAALAMLLASGTILPLRVPRLKFRSAVQMLAALGVRSVAIMAGGYQSAYLTLSALVEQMAVCVVLPYQLVSTNAPAEVELARAVAGGVLPARAAKLLRRPLAVRALASDTHNDVFACVKGALQIAVWPA